MIRVNASSLAPPPVANAHIPPTTSENSLPQYSANGNLYAPIMMIAETAADIIQEINRSNLSVFIFT
jgi:hypothetical protein